MQIQNLFQPFEVAYAKEDRCPIKAHKHTFFELIYILEGEGTYHINANKFNYFPDDLFLVRPMDNHHTTIQKTTAFLFIRFNNIYLKAQKAEEQHSNLGAWIQRLEYILQNSSQLQKAVIANKSDKLLVRAVSDAILLEHLQQQPLQKELLQQLINTLITVVARNVTMYTAEKTSINPHTSLDIINYIHLNIYNPEKLKAENIAAHFNLSLNYISEYFKKHTSENLQQYIINYKLVLVEIRLKHSDMRLNEIAFEFGFTDESHLSKLFKKYKGVSPAVFRKNKEVA